MANIESNTLLEKLTQINNIKNRLRQTIINIGGGDYISEKSPFAAFPRAISRVHSDINNVSKLLEYIDLGGNLEEIADKENAMYKDTIPYIDDILVAKQSLVDNLRIKGVYAEVTEPFDSLVEKVLRIVSNAPSPTPEGEFAFTFNVSNGDCKGEYTISSLGRNFDNNFSIIDMLYKNNKIGKNMYGFVPEKNKDRYYGMMYFGEIPKGIKSNKIVGKCKIKNKNIPTWNVNLSSIDINGNEFINTYEAHINCNTYSSFVPIEYFDFLINNVFKDLTDKYRCVQISINGDMTFRCSKDILNYPYKVQFIIDDFVYQVKIEKFFNCFKRIF